MMELFCENSYVFVMSVCLSCFFDNRSKSNGYIRIFFKKLEKQEVECENLKKEEA